MQGHHFTERTRHVLELAREEAVRLHHEYVGTEHLLLGLLREGNGVASAVLENLGIDATGIARMVHEIIGQGKAGATMPFTTRAKHALELASSASGEMDHPYVGTEHLLIGLLDEQGAIAAQVLQQWGATPESVRAETLRVLGPPR